MLKDEVKVRFSDASVGTPLLVRPRSVASLRGDAARARPSEPAHGAVGGDEAAPRGGGEPLSSFSRSLRGRDEATKALVELNGHPDKSPSLEPMRLLWEMVQHQIVDFVAEYDVVERVWSVEIGWHPSMRWEYQGGARWLVTVEGREEVVARVRRAVELIHETYPGQVPERWPDPSEGGPGPAWFEPAGGERE